MYLNFKYGLKTDFLELRNLGIFSYYFFSFSFRNDTKKKTPKKEVRAHLWGSTGSLNLN